VKQYGPTSAQAKIAADKVAEAQRKVGEATGKVKTTTIDSDEAMKRLAKTYGGQAAKSAETTAGKQKILAVRFQELQEQIGAKLLPVMSKLADWGIKTVDWMSKNGKVIKPLAIAVGVLVGGLFLLVKATRAYTAVQAALNVVMEMNPIGLVVVAIAALVAGLVYRLQEVETFRNIVNGAF
jgi:hypothetical protein